MTKGGQVEELCKIFGILFCLLYAFCVPLYDKLKKIFNNYITKMLRRYTNYGILAFSAALTGICTCRYK